MKNLISVFLIVVSAVATCVSVATADQPQVLFNGKSLDGWEFREDGWAIDDDGTLVCRMETITAKNGTTRQKSMGYIWTKQSYGDFELSLSCKLSEGCNSGVFFRSDKDNPVQGGFEIQLMDDISVQKTRGSIDGKHMNGAFYDAQAASSNPAKPAGQWNQMTLKCVGPKIQVSINGVLVNDVNVDDWSTARENPDGTLNKFTTALKDLPRSGRIGFQNHGKIVWFKDVSVRSL